MAGIGTRARRPQDALTRSATAILLMAVAAAFVTSAWFATRDIVVDEPNVDGRPAFCGSAYDVALIKRDGYMGGDVPANQGAIDSACRHEAWLDIAAAGAFLVGAAALAVVGVMGPRRTLRSA